MATKDTSDYTIGGADLYFSSTVGPDVLQKVNAATRFQTTTRSLGNITTSSISPEVTFVEHWVVDNGKRVKDKTVANTSAIMVNFTFDELNQTNLERFFMGNVHGANASYVAVLDDTLAEGSAMLRVQTAIGQDLVYRIPKCTLRSDGPLEFGTGEDWTTAPMVLEVLQLTENDCSATMWNDFGATAPFGWIETKYIA